MPDDATEVLHQRALRYIADKEAAAETELAPATSGEGELARRPVIVEMHAIFFKRPDRPLGSGRIFADEGEAWRYGNGLGIKPRRVVVILERD